MIFKNSELVQEVSQPQTADQPMALQRRAKRPSRDTEKTILANQPALSSTSS